VLNGVLHKHFAQTKILKKLVVICLVQGTSVNTCIQIFNKFYFHFVSIRAVTDYACAADRDGGEYQGVFRADGFLCNRFVFQVAVDLVPISILQGEDRAADNTQPENPEKIWNSAVVRKEIIKHMQIEIIWQMIDIDIYPKQSTMYNLIQFHSILRLNSKLFNNCCLSYPECS